MNGQVLFVEWPHIKGRQGEGEALMPLMLNRNGILKQVWFVWYFSPGEMLRYLVSLFMWASSILACVQGSL